MNTVIDYYFYIYFIDSNVTSYNKNEIAYILALFNQKYVCLFGMIYNYIANEQYH